MNSTAKYLEKIHFKIEKYALRYPNKPKMIALKLLWQNLKYVCSSMENSGVYSNKPHFSDALTHVAIIIKGGMGDFVIAGKYTKALADYLGKNTQITIMGRPEDLPVINVLFQKQPHIHNILPEDRNCSYDLVIEIIRFPVVLQHYAERLSQKAQKYVDVLENFYAENGALLRNDFLGRAWSLIQRRTRENQADIDNLLNMAKTDFMLKTTADIASLAAKYSFSKDNFITMQSGSGKAFAKCAQEVRQWPAESYGELVQLLKSEYPKIKILQLGDIKQPQIQGVDVDLRGKTSLDECLVLLAAAKLHISQEGGMVIARHFSGGRKSVVLFGATDEKFFSFAENSNLCRRRCSSCCEWLTSDWMKKCVKTGGAAECMHLITPAEVLKFVKL